MKLYTNTTIDSRNIHFYTDQFLPIGPVRDNACLICTITKCSYSNKLSINPSVVCVRWRTDYI